MFSAQTLRLHATTPHCRPAIGGIIKTGARVAKAAAPRFLKCAAPDADSGGSLLARAEELDFDKTAEAFSETVRAEESESAAFILLKPLPNFTG